jgi:BetR domain
MTDYTHVQQRFLNAIKDILPQHYVWVDVLAEVLDISADSAYRRLRGEKLLTLDEIAKLSDKFQISFDSFLHTESGNVTFQYQQLKNSEGFLQYLQNILNHLNTIRSTPGSQIIYAADDVPILHQFYFPEHGGFKMFYWLQSVLQETSLQNKRYHPNLLSEDMLHIGRRIYEVYCDIPSIEIWTDESPSSTLKQIEYYLESGLLDSSVLALQICEQFEEMIRMIQQKAADGSKNNKEHNFQMYQSEVQIGNNCVLVQLGNRQITFVRHQTFNIMHTYQASFCQETEVFLQNMIKKSVLISGVSEKQRYQFFQNIHLKINALKDKISRKM